MRNHRTMHLKLITRIAALVLLVVAMGLLFEGLTLPILAIKKFWIFHDTFSIWSGMKSLYSSGEYFIATILLVFSILFPIGKNLLLFWIFAKGSWLGRGSQRLMRSAAVLGKWSMLDVFIVAIMVASVRLGILAHVQVLSALYFFACSVIITNLISTGMDWWIRREHDRLLLAAEKADSR